MKRLKALIYMAVLSLVLFGCANTTPSQTQVAATTLPVYEFTSKLCAGTDISVTRLVTESVSCLHDYTLKVDQMRSLEIASVVIISGAGLEDFLGDAILHSQSVIDASTGISALHCEHTHDHDHDHSQDSHIWLSPVNAMHMSENICEGLCKQFPVYADIFRKNLSDLRIELEQLEQYANEQLATLSSRELITFHDGFSYFAEAFDLHIVRAVEEESGSEPSAAELKELISLVKEHEVQAIFTETNGSVSAAGVIAAETGIPIFALDMAMAGESYFDAMYHNIDTIQEALG